MSGAPLLALENVASTRGGRLLFEGLDLRLAPGEAALLTGPNGTGKSSLIRIAAGLLRPAGGSVVRNASAALADEALALDQRQTLGQALRFWAGLDGNGAAPAMERLGIARLADVPVRMLSTGQRKRAALARVVASGAGLWLLDEPANGLDEEGQERLAEAMAAHLAEGGAILAASHSPLGLDPRHRLALG